MASDQDEHAWHPYECLEGVTIPSPRREGISVVKQHLSSQNTVLLSGFCQRRSNMDGDFSVGRDEIVVLSAEAVRPKPIMA